MASLVGLGKSRPTDWVLLTFHGALPGRPFIFIKSALETPVDIIPRNDGLLKCRIRLHQTYPALLSVNGYTGLLMT